MSRTIEVDRAVLGDRLVRDGVRVCITGDRIASIETGTGKTGLEATLIPGPIDLQVNGAGGRGVEEATPEALDVIARAVFEGGASAFLPTLITAPFEILLAQIGAVAEWIEAAKAPGARPLGIHLEGPFLELAGAHDPEHLLAPTESRIRAVLAAARGQLKLVTLAPALPGASQAIEALVAAGVAVSIGHAAKPEQLNACLNAGASMATHLYNAMGPLHHREPGLADRLVDDERVCCAMIPDGVHVHPIMLRAAWNRLGIERCLIVTDCMAAAGMPPGRYKLSGKEVLYQDGEVRDAQGTLAGSAILMRAAIERFSNAIPACDASVLAAVASRNPAAVLKDAERGRIAAGMRAELALLHEDGELELLTE